MFETVAAEAGTDFGTDGHTEINGSRDWGRALG